MSLHIPTLMIMLVIASATLMLSVGWVARADTNDGLRRWAVGLLLNTLALGLFGLRGVASDYVSIVGANTALSITYAFFLSAFSQFSARRIAAPWLWAPPLAIALVFPFFMADVQARVAISGAIFGLQHLVMLHMLLTGTAGFRSRGKHLLVIAFSIIVCAVCVRTGAAAFSVWVITDITQNSPLQTLIFVTSFVALLLASNGFVLMVKERSDEILQRQARTDALTGVRNRGSMEAAVRREIERSLRYGQPIALVMIDLDYFKRINDRFGHSAGDAALKAFCAIAQGCIRSTDIFGRWGGEEFMIVSPACNLSDAFELAERVRRSTEEASLEGLAGVPGLTRLNVSCGVAEYRAGEASGDWVGAADKALYDAKRLGRNRVVCAPASDMQREFVPA